MSAVPEPAFPSVSTTVPGPATLKVKDELDVVIDSRTVQMVIDYEKSSGNL